MGYFDWHGQPGYYREVTPTSPRVQAARRRLGLGVARRALRGLHRHRRVARRGRRPTAGAASCTATSTSRSRSRAPASTPSCSRTCSSTCATRSRSWARYIVCCAPAAECSPRRPTRSAASGTTTATAPVHSQELPAPVRGSRVPRATGRLPVGDAWYGDCFGLDMKQAQAATPGRSGLAPNRAAERLARRHPLRHGPVSPPARDHHQLLRVPGIADRDPVRDRR
jgi:hypothetical protein